MKRRGTGDEGPAEHFSTIRQYILSCLDGVCLSAKDLSSCLRIPEKDIYDHLEHIRRTLNKNNRQLKVEPAWCEKCGFLFRKRDRLRKPGRCPICHGSLIKPPLFSVYTVHHYRDEG